MVRWRYFLVVALLLLLPVKTGSKLDDDDEEERPDESDEEEDDDDDDDDEETSEKNDREPPSTAARRAPTAPVVTTKAATKMSTVTKTEKKRPLECYVCAYKSETPMRSCLDPTKFRVHTLTCHSADDKCFTSIISKHNAYEAVVRGCRSNCIGTPDTTCCELNRCNNQALAMPTPAPKSLVAADTATSSAPEKSLQPNVLFFVTILLVLQTVVRVVIV
ncbi:uncharacterized protein LOC128674163 isoform X2 [Plodia interpunctella]|uniref:uncharacterized protein LOC128674163 isoform X2 n=1 Tax=Plodia interpunctella TaxID=58824 RepID=UPI002367511A|nr:uncharacterized protein LOC128674163 isoform X2 [Plodia interpunctella]